MCCSRKNCFCLLHPVTRHRKSHHLCQQPPAIENYNHLKSSSCSLRDAKTLHKCRPRCVSLTSELHIKDSALARAIITFWCKARSDRYRRLIVHTSLFLITFVCYANAIRGDFVHDDLEAIVRNPDVTSSDRSVFQLFRNDFWGRPMSDPLSHKSYRPITVLSFR